MNGAYDTSASLLSGLRRADQATRYESCWERFVDRYTPEIYQWCRQNGLDHDATEEVTQRLMVRLVETLREFRYDPAQSFRSWLFICTRNVIHGYWQEQSRRRSRPFPDQQDFPQQTSLVEHLQEQFDLEFEQEARHRVQAETSARDWNVFRQLTESPASPSAVAAEHGLSLDHVYKIKSRIVAALRQEVERLRHSGIGPRRG